MNNGIPNPDSYKATGTSNGLDDNINGMNSQVIGTAGINNVEVGVSNQAVQPAMPEQTPLVNEQSAPVAENTELLEVPEELPVVEPSVQVSQVAPVNNLTDEVGQDPFATVPSAQDESVGQIPPEAKKKNNPLGKILFTLLILILIGGVAYGIYYYLNMGTTASGAVTPKNMTHNLSEEINTNINDYATFNGISSNSCVLSTVNVDVNTIGSYEYTITCGEDVYKGALEVVDMNLPEVVLNRVYKSVDAEVTADEFIESCSKENCEYTFADSVDVENLTSDVMGLTEVEIIVTDDNDLSTTVTAELIVTSNEIIAFLKGKGSEMDMTDYTGTYIQNDYLGIDGSNNYADYSYRVYEYTFTNEDEFTNVMEEYKSADEFDGMTGEITFDEDEKMLSLRVPLTKETLDLEYDGTFPTTYSAIKSYYENNDYTVQTVSK